ncbi:MULTISPECIES: acyltransferase [unclassified Janthinobacterium]|uniref:acyltransferase family protein n=1 Tax=unclassified Janthinobacterium TaxID=2610881 RepID=UPI001847BDF3|nr:MULTISPECIES: acyltransferase [unclassified Janthinobacterium]MBB5370025.1 peptidoglycan/LPS O-acetylase OafA/YrhL [Janthinobacterium sp. K2C7]MBB5382831.1 peptidoglycan/LPS O-acetylase OafA/YrhL [Janthinobacterium sp. K2Li3]MBB5384816.1 peptidoglycan/LPS O-acetylase OafA/YrhL [Janthinobacterium sp. K2E3]
MSERMVFAHLLRGIGSIFVLISHYVGIFWIMHPDISNLMGAPVISNFPHLTFPLNVIADYCIFFGQFGVGAFFILSGFVIPFSLKNTGTGEFLFRRAIRIYPVYIVGFSLAVMAIFILSYYTGSSFKYSIGDILAHFGVITRAPMDVVRIDGISWTLEVEIYFYIIMAIAGSVILNFNVKGFFATTLLIACICAYYLRGPEYLIGVQIGSGLLLLLGIAYYSFLSGKISRKNLILIELLIFISIMILWLAVTKRASYTIQWMAGYLVAISIFHIGFDLRKKIRTNSILSHFSDISYPLYVVHALFGYTIMYVLVDKGAGVYLAITTATISSYLIAVMIHVFVEKPTMALSKSRGRTLFTSKP